MTMRDRRVTVTRMGTRAECENALRMIPAKGVWDGQKVVHGRLVGKAKYERHGAYWRVEQEMVLA